MWYQRISYMLMQSKKLSSQVLRFSVNICSALFAIVIEYPISVNTGLFLHASRNSLIISTHLMFHL